MAMSLEQAQGHADSILTTAAATIAGLTREADIVRDRPAQDIADARKRAIDAAASVEVWS